MPPPRPPSRIEPLSFPVFAISWFGNPSDGTSFLAYCGGGGSARTGINNAIIIHEGDFEPRQINTGDQIGVALQMYQNPMTGNIWLAVALGNEVRRYSMPEGELCGVCEVGEQCNTITVNAMADTMAVGCENGLVKVYGITDEDFDNEEERFTLDTHEKAVCSIAFSLREGRLITSAKDGTACVYQGQEPISGFKCSVVDDSASHPKRKPRSTQVLVRGCAFLDMDGRAAVTVASARRGKAFLARWYQKPGDTRFQCLDRIACSDSPISAMSLSQDASLLAFGSVDGSIILWDVQEWKPLKKYNEVHELPVTCIAARPYPTALQGENDGVQIHARSASADSQLACLTLQRRAPRSSGGAPGIGLFGVLHRIMLIFLIVLFFSPVFHEFQDKCSEKQGFSLIRQCLVEDVLVAPSWRAGVSSPPY